MKTQKGQALVLVLLSLAVVLTLILYILSRSVTDVAISSRKEESVRAFSAAEAGIEHALVIGSNLANTIGDASYTATVTGYSQGSADFLYPFPLNSGDTMTTWFLSHDVDGNLSSTDAFTGSSVKICWGNPNTDSNLTTTPGVEVIIYYESTPNTPSTMKVARVALDPNSARAASNGFTVSGGSCVIGDNTYSFSSTINFADVGILPGSFNMAGGLQFAKIKMFYNTDVSHTIGVTVTGGLLPSQGKSVISTGMAGGSNRRISVFESWPENPFSGTSLISPVGITK